MRSHIYLFHRVSPEKSLLWPPLHPKDFERIIRYISKISIPVQLEEWIRNPIHSERRPITSIVFDDGYKDYLEYALPILERYNVPSSMYIITNCADSGALPWTHELDYLFEHTKYLAATLDFSDFPKFLQQTTWHTPEARIMYGRKLKPYLKNLPRDSVNQICHQIRSIFSDVELPQLMMNWDDIRQAQTVGVEIGSHTVTHSMLSSIEDESEIRMELSESAATIHKQLGFTPTTISYPIGSYDERVQILSEQTGYKLGLVVDNRPYNYNNDSLFGVPRILINTESIPKTFLRMTGIIRLVKKIMRKPL